MDMTKGCSPQSALIARLTPLTSPDVYAVRMAEKALSEESGYSYPNEFLTVDFVWYGVMYERFVQSVAGGYENLYLEDYQNDLSGCESLHLLLQRLPADLRQSLREPIAELDERFRQHTDLIDVPLWSSELTDDLDLFRRVPKRLIDPLKTDVANFIRASS